MPAVADVDGDGAPDLIEGGDSSALHAFGAGGRQVAGFPKFHSGWILYSPTVGDLDSDGKNDVVALTREGYLSAWKTEGKASANDEWWSYRHDDRNTARYGTDTRPPGVPRSAKFDGEDTLRFTAPGDDWYQRRAKSYRLRFNNAGAAATRKALRGRRAGRVRATQSGSDATVATTGAAGATERVKLPSGTRAVRVQAVDAAGNLGRAVSVRARMAQTRARTDPRGGRSGEEEAPGGPVDGGGGLPLTGVELLGLLMAGLALLCAGRLLRSRTG